MPEEFTSPEEKLLRLIRGDRRPKNKAVPLPDKEKISRAKRRAGRLQLRRAAK